MKTYDFVIFISIVLTIYISVHTYIFMRGWQALPASSVLRFLYCVIFIFMGLTYIAGRITENISVCAASDFFIWTGSFWLGLILYLFLFAVFFDIIRLADHFFTLYPPLIRNNYQYVKAAAALFSLTATIIIVAAGHINTLHPRITTVSLHIPKSAGTVNTMNIVLATDIHLGTIISNSRVDTLVHSINSCDPDIVLLGGDIVDEDLKPVIENNMGDMLLKIKSKHGIFAITGNHEYIGGADSACRFMREHGITVLRDEYVLIDKSIILVGREDLSKNRFTGIKRKTLKTILDGADMNYPVICMDHQPFMLDEAAGNGVDLQLSGHTHAGQLWPFNYIVDMIYQVGKGYARIGNTHFFVSTGFGTWGPPVRTGNRPEIVQIKLKFRE